MTDKPNTRFVQDGLTVAHLQQEMLQKSLTVAHIAEALGNPASTPTHSSSAPTASAEQTTTPATNRPKT